ncbi:hypothetical protein CDCA_CDCA11G3265 [Cyanidium caldarium]|uniref:T-complex protein 1 subunit gamma n=1 Tax=Cyanidium caldarium TaxID=2771 RepID=A0AAV9IYS8_CYACA|nr:hypothetical protein CDCA_CDCA11G3265 [Cyanidium caldarium]
MQRYGQAPVYIINTNAERTSGRQAQLSNVAAAKAVADVIRTTLGPRAMLKLILDAMGGVVITSDGNAILREIDVGHPAAKAMIDLARTQDEEVGDGTTSVIVLAGSLLAAAEPCLEGGVHPTVIVGAYMRALEDALEVLDRRCARPVDAQDDAVLRQLVHTCVGTKIMDVHRELITQLVIDAVRLVSQVAKGTTPQSREVDIKHNIRIEKVPGGELSGSRVLRGVLLNKDVLHPQMRRRIEQPRVVLLDCPLEYKKGESQASVEVTNEQDWDQLLRLEEEYVQQLCNQVIAVKPDVVITEKGVSDLAAHFLAKANITALRRVRRTDNQRVALATGARIVSRPEELQAADVGTGAGLYEVRKLGDEYFSFLEECREPRACTILLRGGSKDVLNEVERNLHDALAVARNVLRDPRLVAGGGAAEMTLRQGLLERAGAIEGAAQLPYRAVAQALEVIPRTLAENCGASVIRVMTRLRALHAQSSDPPMGVDGITGEVANMAELGVFESYAVKAQSIKTAIESACMLLRIDDVLSGVRKKDGAGGAQESGGFDRSGEDAGNEVG